MSPGMAAVWAIGRLEIRQAVRSRVWTSQSAEIGRPRMSPTMEWGELLEIDRHPMPIANPFMMPPMSIFGFARITFLVSGVLAFAAAVAAQATRLDPARFVASIYADSREGVVWAEWLDGARRREWFSSALTALWAKCDARAHKTEHELGAVDFDVATNSQGLEVCVSSRGTLRMRASSRRSRRTIGCVNRSGRTRSDTTLSGSVDAGRSTTSIP